MIVITFNNLIMASMFLLAIATVALIVLYLYWYVNGSLTENQIHIIFPSVVCVLIWIIIFSLPCTGFQMIQFGRQVITPDMCSIINSGVF